MGGKGIRKFKYRRSKKTGADPVATFLSLLLNFLLSFDVTRDPRGKVNLALSIQTLFCNSYLDVISYFLCLANLLFYDVNSCQLKLSF